MTNPKKTLLDKLISEAPEENDGAVSLQLQIDGQTYAGAVKNSSDHEGLYELITVGQQQHGTLMVTVYFDIDSVGAIFVPSGETSQIVTGRPSGIISGVS